MQLDESTLDTTRRYGRCGHLLTAPDGDELLVLDPQAMAVHTLNPSLAMVFELCDGETSTEEIVVAMVDRWGLEVSDASRETYRALGLLRDAKLIEGT